MDHVHAKVEFSTGTGDEENQDFLRADTIPQMCISVWGTISSLIVEFDNHMQKAKQT